MKTIVLLAAAVLWLTGGSLLAAQSCVDLSGAWSVSEEATVTVTSGGETDSQTNRGSGTVTIAQNGCSISFYSEVVNPLDGETVRVLRTGTISGNQVTYSGAAVLPVPGISCPGNVLTGKGVIAGNQIVAQTTARFTCSGGGQFALIEITGTETFTSQRVILPAPTITLQPASVTVTNGGRAIFTVVAGGTPPLVFQWQKDGVNIPGAGTSTLTLANVTPEQAGQYRVLVSNSAGSVFSQPATLTVRAAVIAPAIVEQPASATVLPGASWTLRVVANGGRPLQYQWNKDGLALSGQTNALLVLTNVQLADAGRYTARVSNQGGSVLSDIAFLTVTAPNTPPSIDPIPNQTTIIGTATAWITLRVTDRETALAELSVYAITDNSELLPPGAVQFSRAGAEQRIQLLPRAGRAGQANVTVGVRDGGGQEKTTKFIFTAQPNPEQMQLRLGAGNENEVEITTSIPEGGPYSLEGSADLRAWTEVAQLSGTGQWQSRIQRLPPGVQSRFYRVRFGR